MKNLSPFFNFYARRGDKFITFPNRRIACKIGIVETRREINLWRRGYSAEGFRSWQRTACRLESGAGASGICLNDQGGNRMEVSEDVAATLRAEPHGHPPCVVDETIPLEHHPIDSRITMTDNGKVQTLTSHMGTGGNNVPIVMKIRSGCEGGGKGPLVQTDKSATLSCNNDQTVFVPFGISSYQSHAIVKLTEGILIIAPLLFMGSRPERNLISVVSTKHDDAYSREVNELEEQMVTELEAYVSSPYTAKRKHLRADLPDIDFAVFDPATNSSLICEMKWFAAADSTKEVLAKEDEITHGCEQAESILTYAMSDRQRFIKQVFNVDITDAVDLFCCVVAKHNIRTQHKYVPVIDLKRMEELLESYSLNTVFHMVRNHEYEIPFPKGATIAHQTIRYAGFEFRVPAICFDSLQI